jgi:membrane-associated phospholipid phosphatase
VFLPAFPRAWRRTVVIVVGAVVALIGFSRLALGVHFMTDVIGAWSLGVAWVGLCAAAFELIRHEQGRRVTEPLTEGLEPEAAADLRPTEPHEPPAAPARGGATRAGAALRAGKTGSVGLAARPDAHAAPRTDAGRTDAGRTDASRTDVTRTVGRRTDAGRAGQTGGADAKGSEGPHGGHGRLWVAAGLAVAWVLTFGALVGLGVPLAKYRNGNGNILGDSTIPHWFAAHRADALARISIIGSEVGNTHAILAIGLVVGAVALAAVRRWRPVVFLVTVMFGELTLFLSTAALVGRDRPDVENMDGPMPTSSYPSGHVAATICIWTVIALLVVPRTRAWWRWLFVAAAVLMPLWVAVSRMYRGMHHPTDILGSCLLAAVWVAAAWWLMRPNADRDEPPARTRKTLQTARS